MGFSYSNKSIFLNLDWCCQLRKFSQANLDPVSRFRGLIVNNDNDVLEFFTACKSHHLGLNSESKHTFLADSLIVLSEKAKAKRSLSIVQHQLRRGTFLRWWSAEFVEVLKANNVVNLPSIILALSKLNITCKDLPDRWVDIYLTSIIRPLHNSLDQYANDRHRYKPCISRCRGCLAAKPLGGA